MQIVGTPTQGYDNREFFTVSESFGESVSLWSTSTLKKVDSFTPNRSIQNMTFSADGRYLLTGDGEDYLALRDGRNGKKISRIKVSQSEHISEAVFSFNGDYLAIGTNDFFNVYERKTTKKVFSFKRPNRRNLDSIVLSADGKYLLGTNLVDGTLWLWNTKTGKLVDKGKAKATNELAFLGPCNLTIIASDYGFYSWKFKK